MVASAVKSAFNATKEAQSSLKLVCESIKGLNPTELQLAVDHAASSTEMQKRLGFVTACK